MFIKSDVACENNFVDNNELHINTSGR